MPNNRLKLCMLSGSFEYDSEASLTVFQEYIEDNHPIQATQIIYHHEDDNQSLESLQDTDVLLVFTRRLNTTGKELDCFKAYCAAGNPIVGVRTASHAYQNWLGFDKEVLGGDYQGHYGAGPIARAEINPNAKDHPILQGISNFDSYGSLYRNPSIATDTTLLLMGKTEEHAEPVAWTRTHHGGRVFYTSLGHQRDFEIAMFLRLLANGVLWAGGHLDTI